MNQEPSPIDELLQVGEIKIDTIALRLYVQVDAPSIRQLQAENAKLKERLDIKLNEGENPAFQHIKKLEAENAKFKEEWGIIDKYAQRLFKVTLQLGLLEEALYRSCDEVFKDCWSDFGYDYYDESLEIYGINNDTRLTEAEALKLLDLGFGIIYVNHKDGFETHYSRSNLTGWRTTEARHRGIIDHSSKERYKLKYDLSKAQAQCAEMKKALENIRVHEHAKDEMAKCDGILEGDKSGYSYAVSNKALSSDCGKNFVPLEVVEKMEEALKSCNDEEGFDNASGEEVWEKWFDQALVDKALAALKAWKEGRV